MVSKPLESLREVVPRLRGSMANAGNSTVRGQARQPRHVPHDEMLLFVGISLSCRFERKVATDQRLKRGIVAFIACGMTSVESHMSLI
jgi:hypothetical protein